jgi:PKHD-type hydroxylase
MAKVFYPFSLEERDMRHVVNIPKVFDSSECKKIIDMMKAPKEGTLEGSSVSKKIRDSSVEWLDLNDDTRFIYERLEKEITLRNQAVWKYDLDGFGEKLQLTRYVKGQHYDWHRDSGKAKLSNRKLSCVVLLSKPSDYQGGELEFFGKESDSKAHLEQGSVVLFPSFMHHRVTEVTAGTRYSLVVWVTGRPLR